MKKLLIAATLAALVATTGAQAKTLRWATSGDAQTMDPYSRNEGVTNNMNEHIYDYLVGRDEKLEKVPMLAEKWTQVDATTWRFNIRKNVKFHDGSALTADDVVFSYERAAHPNSQIANYARAMGKPTKIDDYTVEFKLEKPNPILLEHASTVFIMSKAWSEKNNVTKPLSFKDKEETFASRNAMGTGPFILVSREPEVRTVLKRNPNYWGKPKGNVTEVIHTPIKSDATRTAALLSGELDLVQDPPPQDGARLSAPGGRTKVLYGMENRVVFFGFDQGRDELLYSNVKGKNPFKDRKVRQAFHQAIDIDTIKKRIMRDQSVIVGCMTPSPLACTAPELDKNRLPYNVDAAKKLLEEAGYKDGFEVTLDCPNDRYINDDDICQAVVGMLGRIGVKVKLNAQSKTTYFSKLEKLDTSFYMLGWGGAITDAQTTLEPIMHTYDQKTQRGYYNYGRYSDPKLDELINAAASEVNVEKRRDQIKQALTLHNQEVRHIVLHRQMIPWAVRSNVVPVHSADNYMRAHWVTVN
ncbi:MAG: ABC transporter substrate-binding protein [Burkholderiaceae bacterium]